MILKTTNLNRNKTIQNHTKSRSGHFSGTNHFCWYKYRTGQHAGTEPSVQWERAHRMEESDGFTVICFGPGPRLKDLFNPNAPCLVCKKPLRSIKILSTWLMKYGSMFFFAVPWFAGTKSLEPDLTWVHDSSCSTKGEGMFQFAAWSPFRHKTGSVGDLQGDLDLMSRCRLTPQNTLNDYLVALWICQLATFQRDPKT